MNTNTAPLRAYNGDAEFKSKLLADELCLAVIRAGLVIVNAEEGTAISKRFYGKQLGATNAKGCRVCTLHFNGQRKQIKLHRLIWISVHGIPDPKLARKYGVSQSLAAKIVRGEMWKNL